MKKIIFMIPLTTKKKKIDYNFIFSDNNAFLLPSDNFLSFLGFRTNPIKWNLYQIRLPHISKYIEYYIKYFLFQSFYNDITKVLKQRIIMVTDNEIIVISIFWIDKLFYLVNYCIDSKPRTNVWTYVTWQLAIHLQLYKDLEQKKPFNWQMIIKCFYIQWSRSNVRRFLIT